MVATVYARGRPVRTTARPVSVWRQRWATRIRTWRYTARRTAYRGGRVVGRQAAVAWARLAPASLSIFGLGSLTAAAFQAGVVAGLVALGVSCFVLEWRVSR